MARFADRVAVVTGGAGGIGRAVCAALVAEGARVAVVDLDETAVSTAVAAMGERAEGFTVDVRDPEAVEALMQEVHDRLGGPHLLVTLAGGSLGTPRDLDEIEPEDVDLVVDVNVKGTFYCCQAAVPYLAEEGGGAIVTTISQISTM